MDAVELHALLVAELTRQARWETTRLTPDGAGAFASSLETCDPRVEIHEEGEDRWTVLLQWIPQREDFAQAMTEEFWAEHVLPEEAHWLGDIIAREDGYQVELPDYLSQDDSIAEIRVGVLATVTRAMLEWSLRTQLRS